MVFPFFASFFCGLVKDFFGGWKKKSEIFFKKVLTLEENMRNWSHNQKRGNPWMIKKVNSTRRGAEKKAPFKNMNTQDRDNIRMIESERARLAGVVKDECYASGGLSISVGGRIVDIRLERQKRGEYARIFYVFTRFSELEKKTVLESLAIASLESEFLTSDDIYKLLKAGLKALNARGW